jgi:hypothetical protein
MGETTTFFESDLGIMITNLLAWAAPAVIVFVVITVAWRLMRGAIRFSSAIVIICAGLVLAGFMTSASAYTKTLADPSTTFVDNIASTLTGLFGSS